MSSSSRLNAFSGRDVVYCHSCSNEWYRDQGGLQCPGCEGDIVEIVSPEHDPRPGFDPNEIFHQPRSAATDHGDDVDHEFGDPDEADIEEHTEHGPNGITMRQTTYRMPDRHQSGAARAGRPPAGANDQMAILQHFHDMLLNDFNVGTAGRSGRQALYTAPGATAPGNAQRAPGTGLAGHAFRGGSTTFTIATGPVHHGVRGLGGPTPASDARNFNVIFGNVIGGGGLRRPQVIDETVSPTSALMGGLHDIIVSLFDPANAVNGDGVYTDEALQRVINNIMEANPTGNAAPPAPQNAIDNLELKLLDQKMMGENNTSAECTICMDDMHLGNQVAVLPCTHWFHKECVTLWLNQHNSCPVCRKPLGANATVQPAEPHAEASEASLQPPIRRSSFPPTAAPLTHRPAYTPSENQQRLDRIRDVGGRGDDSFTPEPLDSPSIQGTPSQYYSGSASRSTPYAHNYTPHQSHHDRRVSNSSYYGQNRDYATADYQRRVAQRRASRDSGGSHHTSTRGGSSPAAAASSHNPFTWIRDRFTGGGASNGEGSGSGAGRR